MSVGRGREPGRVGGPAAISYMTITSRLALLLAVGACLFFSLQGVCALPQKACHDQSSFQSWIQKAEDPKLSSDKQHEVFEQALAACPSDPDLYNAFSLFLLKHRDFAASLRWTKRGLQIAPTNPDLQLNLSVALLSMGQTDEALSVLKQLPSGPKAQFYLGMAYRNLGDHRAARGALAKAFELGYDDPYVLYTLIEQERALGDKENGLKHFQVFYERFPDSPFLHLLLGDASLFKDNSVDAEHEYREALRLDPNLPMVNFRLGYLEFRAARYGKAEAFFREEINLSPAFADSHLYLGACLHRLGQDAAAIPFLEQAIARDPNSHLAHRELAAVQLETDHADAALKVLRTAILRLPDDQALHAQLAHLLNQLGHPDEAKKEAELAQKLSARGVSRERENLESSGHGGVSQTEEVVPQPQETAPARASGDISSRTVEPTIHPELERIRECLERADVQCATGALSAVTNQQLRQSPEFLFLQARTLTLQHKYPSALGTIKVAVQKDPSDVQFSLLEGELYQRTGDQVSAIQTFLKCHELAPRSPVPVYSLGMSFFSLGYYHNDSKYYDRAVRHFKLALELDPMFSKADFMLGVVEVVRFNLSDAKPFYERALQLDPQNAYYHLHYGVLLSRMGDSDRCLDELRLAAKLNPSYALTHFSLGNLFARLGRYQDARIELEDTVNLDPNLANAFYSLGGVYHHLGLDAHSQKAYRDFQSLKNAERVQDPVEATLSLSAPTGAEAH